MKLLVTGGAGFIGRWVVKQLLGEGHEVWILDNFSNGRRENIEEFKDHSSLKAVVKGDIKDEALVAELFGNRLDVCIHLAARINVQDSIDNPRQGFLDDVVGTFNLLENARLSGTRFIFVSTCMVYQRSTTEKGISEVHQVTPASPYAASKLAGESLVLSYHRAYDLPTTVLRPFNTYGPFQKGSGEGGVIAVFITRKLAGHKLAIFGDGSQTRDFLYVADCADFIIRAACSHRAVGQIVNAGSGRDTPINDLARLIATDPQIIEHVPHIHPQSEIPRLLCDCSKARELLDWSPKVSLEQGIKLTEDWIRQTI